MAIRATGAGETALEAIVSAETVIATAAGTETGVIDTGIATAATGIAIVTEAIGTATAIVVIVTGIVAIATIGIIIGTAAAITETVTATGGHITAGAIIGTVMVRDMDTAITARSIVCSTIIPGSARPGGSSSILVMTFIVTAISATAKSFRAAAAAGDTRRSRCFATTPGDIPISRQAAGGLIATTKTVATATSNARPIRGARFLFSPAS